MPPLETILEQQRRLLTSIENIEGLVRRGRLNQCRDLIEGFESDLNAAIDAPILLHLQSRLALLQTRIRRLDAIVSEARGTHVRTVDTEDDPLVGYRANLGKAVIAPDLNEELSVPDTTQIWWRCSRNPQHRPWKATEAQTTRGRPCPRCMVEANLSRDAWFPTDTQRGAPWLDAFNYAMLWPGFG